MTWFKTHERKLWWVVLVASWVIALIRDPQCVGRTPWWAWVVPAAVLFVFFIIQWRLIRGLRNERPVFTIPEDQPEGERTLPNGSTIRWKVQR